MQKCKLESCGKSTRNKDFCSVSCANRARPRRVRRCNDGVQFCSYRDCECKDRLAKPLKPFKSRPTHSHIWSESELREAVASSVTLLQAAQKLNSSGTISTLAAYRRVREQVTRFEIPTAHILGQSVNRGKIGLNRSLEEILRDSTSRSSLIRERLIAEGVRPHRCEGCGLTEWQGLPIPLELDHIDGNKHNNNIENVRLLCCNCHAQTPTWRRRKDSLKPL